jgi:hypothetical protein
MKFGIIPTIVLTLFWLSIPLNLLYSQDEELDLDAMWENTVWEEIKEVTIKDYEIEKVTTVAGVRGAEAEDEALNMLYYRKSMRSLSLLDLQKVYGKLVAKKEKMEKDKVNTDVIDNYILVINKKIKTYTN